jgi:parvulin-like peptidyl-prolyl isomerase/exonuclease VII small subunit
MLGGIVFSGFGMNVANNPGGPVDVVSPEAAVATVGASKVTRGDLERRLTMVLQQQQMMGGPAQIPPAERERYRYMLLEGLKREQAVVLAAEKKGVKVTDAQIAAEREKAWEMQRSQYARMLNLKEPEKATDAEIDRALAEQAPGRGITVQRLKADIPTDQIRLQLYNQGLTDAIKKDVKIDEAEVKKSLDEVQVRHILIKSGPGGLPDGQAKAKAEKILAEVKANPAKMPDLAKQHSDDGNKKEGGFYDWSPANKYVPEFSKAALEAGVGKVYPSVVKTQFGYHIVKCEGLRPAKDWDKEKQKYLDQAAQEKSAPQLQAAIDAELPNVKVEITDPSLLASQYEDEASKATDEKIKNTKYEQAIAELAKVKKEDDPYGIVPVRKARIYQAMKKTKEAIAAYEEALAASNTVETRLALAQLYLDDKNKEAAGKQLEEADKLAIPDITMQMQLAGLWKQVGNEAKAKAAQDKSQAMIKRMMEMQQAQQPQITPPPAPQEAPAPKSGTPAPPAPKP